MKTDLIHKLTPLKYSQDFSGDTMGVLLFQNDQSKAVLNSQTLTEIRELSDSGTFTAATKSAFFVRRSYIEELNIIVAGLGNKKKSTPESARQAGAVVFQKLNSEKVKSFGFDLDAFLQASTRKQAEPALHAFLEGFYLASYRFDRHKSKQTPLTLESIEIVSRDKKNQKWVESLIHSVLVTVDSIFIARDFSNEPSNIGTPVFFASEVSRFAKKFGLKCRVLTEADAKKEKMGLFLSVSAGSEREGRIVVLEYSPKKAAKSAKTVSLVGKGVTFDAGGISLKPSMKMEDMKHDMTGAATMLGATLLAARLGSPNKLFTILAFCENMPSGTATQPGNVIRSRAGKTVEIINTDAEGRLVLADALDYAQDFKPDVIVNSATLTGACNIALGRLCSALFSNDTQLTKKLQAATETSEEALWELPLWDEYFDDMKSNCADMMNSVNDSFGGTIRGAIFLKQFIREGTKWAHIDIANRAYNQGYLPYNPSRGASGAYVRTLAEFAKNYR